jgi:dTDP-4-dehydrorhamnose reductase
MIVLTGATGRLGKSLSAVFPNASRPSREQMNVTDGQSIESYLRELPTVPDVVVHAAAMTDVRLAEGERKLCWDTNVVGTENLVSALQQSAPNCHFVYVSTACVFQGDVGEYTEDDQPYPKNFYGLTKLVAEYVAKRMQSHLVVRTNFVAREPWPYPRAFTDRFGTYLFADDVAYGIADLVQRKLRGLVHLVGSQKLSMFELAKMTRADVDPMTLDEVELPLTVDMSLRSNRIASISIGHHQLTTR